MNNRLKDIVILYIIMSCKTLEEMIKILPDDMIIKIKGYVINPYKFIPELKLYKLPHYTYRISTVFNNWVLETINDMCFERHFYLELFHAIKYDDIAPEYDYIKEVLKNLNIKGRNKLIKYTTDGGVVWGSAEKNALITAIYKSTN